jgi:hypothetical protein
VLAVNLLRKQLDRVLIRDVFDHERGAGVLADAICVDLEVERVQLSQSLAVVVVGEVEGEVAGGGERVLGQPHPAVPFLLAPPLLALAPLLPLLPRAAHPPRLDLLQDQVRHLSRHIGRPLLPRARQRLLFGVFPLRLRGKLLEYGASAWRLCCVLPLNKGTQTVHGDVELDCSQGPLRLRLAGRCLLAI